MTGNHAFSGTTKSWVRRLTITAAVTAAVGVSSCTAFLGQNTTQCNSTEECLKHGPGFADSVCNSDHLCEKVVSATACSTNDECVQRNGGAPFFCRKADKQCVSLTTRDNEDCTQVLADISDYSDDNTIYLGVMMPKSGPQTAAAAPIIHAVELARRDFKLSSKGLPPAKEGGPRRPLAFVVCDEQANYERAARHLIEDLRVPAIVGPSFSSNVAKLSTDYAAGADVLLMGPTGGAATISGLKVSPKGKRLVWRTVPSDIEHGFTSAALVPLVETQLRSGTAPIVPAGESVRVAVIHRGDNYGTGLASAVIDHVKFNNGKTAAENGANFLVINYGDPADTVNNPNPDPKYADAALKLKEFAPHIVVVAGADEFNQKILAPTEANWSAPHRPRWLYVAGPALNPALLKVMNDQPASNKDLRTRLTASVAGRTGQLWDRFRILYTSNDFTAGTIPSFYAAGGYDAAYLLAYAIVGAGDQLLTGTSLAAGLERLNVPGNPIPTGANSISSAFDALTRHQSIDYDGAVGPLDFDPKVGEGTNDIQIYCVTAVDGQAKGFAPSGAFYSPKTRQISGQVACL